jgi:hypothetical protein
VWHGHPCLRVADPMEKTNASLLKGLGVGTLAGVCFGLGGFFLSEIPSTQGMGMVMFWLTPMVAGFAIALVTPKPNTVLAAMLLSALVSLMMLVAIGKEGLLCAVLAFPLLAAGIALGAVCGNLFRKYVMTGVRNQSMTMMLIFLAAPAFILAGHRAEYRELNVPREEIVASSVTIAASPDEIWPHILSIDSIAVPKPFLMYIGLPIPVRCQLVGSGVGAKRTCYFEKGSIEETITEWSPPYAMSLSIDRTNMPGRHWLGFENAQYQLRQEGSATRLIRTTTIISHLHPIWYWRYFERLGVESEHEYILNDVARQFK